MAVRNIFECDSTKAGPDVHRSDVHVCSHLFISHHEFRTLRKTLHGGQLTCSLVDVAVNSRSRAQSSIRLLPSCTDTPASSKRQADSSCTERKASACRAHACEGRKGTLRRSTKATASTSVLINLRPPALINITTRQNCWRMAQSRTQHNQHKGCIIPPAEAH